MTGTYSSFQQAQQTHDAPVEPVHRHVHLEMEITRREDGHLSVRIVQDRQLEIGREVWIQHADRLFRPLDSLFAHVEAIEDGLAATISAGPLAHPLPYRMLRA